MAQPWYPRYPVPRSTTLPPPYPWNPAWYTTRPPPPGGELLLSPWWIAAIVCACVIILMILFCICLFLCRRNSGELCYSPDGCLMCCVGLSCDRCLRHEQPYRTRRRRHIRPVVMSHRSIDRPVYSSGSELSGYSAPRVRDDVSQYDGQSRVIVEEVSYVEPSRADMFWHSPPSTAGGGRNHSASVFNEARY